MTKTIVLTGGSSGIGEATLDIFTQQGWKGINIALTPCQIPNVQNFIMDFAFPEKIDEHAEELKKAVCHPEALCLVHNAGCKVRDNVTNISLEDLKYILNVNVISSAMLNKIFIPLMKPGSSIFYLGSMLSDRGVPGNASYILSKHAVLGLMRATCQDLAGKHITSNCVCPGFVNTRLLDEGMDSQEVQYLLKNYVIGQRLIEPSEVAKVIFDCAHSPVINGAIIPVNLGLVAS